MGFLWFAIISVMLTGYVILDGFDIGAGALHLFLGRTDDERKKIIRSIGPVWDGNEVWLLATGGVLYFVFPQLYASSFSGFYLPLMMVLWLLMLRAIGLEFRTHIERRHLGELLRRHLFHRQSAAGDLLRCGAGQRGARSAAWAGSLLLPSPVDQLERRRTSGRAGLVYGAFRRGRAGCALRAWRQLHRGEDRWRTE